MWSAIIPAVIQAGVGLYGASQAAEANQQTAADAQRQARYEANTNRVRTGLAGHAADAIIAGNTNAARESMLAGENAATILTGANTRSIDDLIRAYDEATRGVMSANEAATYGRVSANEAATRQMVGGNTSALNTLIASEGSARDHELSAISSYIAQMYGGMDGLLDLNTDVYATTMDTIDRGEARARGELGQLREETAPGYQVLREYLADPHSLTDYQRHELDQIRGSTRDTIRGSSLAGSGRTAAALIKDVENDYVLSSQEGNRQAALQAAGMLYGDYAAAGRAGVDLTAGATDARLTAGNNYGANAAAVMDTYGRAIAEGELTKGDVAGASARRVGGYSADTQRDNANLWAMMTTGNADLTGNLATTNAGLWGDTTRATAGVRTDMERDNAQINANMYTSNAGYLADMHRNNATARAGAMGEQSRLLGVTAEGYGRAQDTASDARAATTNVQNSTMGTIASSIADSARESRYSDRISNLERQVARI